MTMQILSKVSSDVHLCNLALQVTSFPELETIYTCEWQRSEIVFHYLYGVRGVGDGLVLFDIYA